MSFHIKRAMNKTGRFHTTTVLAKSLCVAPLLVALFACLGNGCGQGSNASKQKTPQRYSYNVKIERARFAGRRSRRGTSVFKKKLQIHDTILIDKFAVLKGEMQAEEFDAKLEKLRKTIGQAGFCRELALAASSGERVQANYLNEMKIKAADLAADAVKMLRRRYENSGCRFYCTKKAKAFARDNEPGRALLWYFMAAEHLEISRHRLFAAMESLKRKKVENDLSLCSLLKQAHKEALSLRQEKLDTNKNLGNEKPDKKDPKDSRTTHIPKSKRLYEATMVETVKKSIEAVMEAEKCKYKN